MTNPTLCPRSDCALLVVSCDPYADLWPPFFSLLKRYWPDCPFDVALGAGPAAIAPEGVLMLRSDGGRDWSRCTMEYLDALPHPYVLVVLDDFFFRRRVATADILRCLAFLKASQGVQLRLVPRPKPTTYIKGEPLIGACEQGSPYRLSTQAAIWNRQQLRALLRVNESIWEFEHNGNLRADMHTGGFYSVWRAVLPYEGRFSHHVVEKGKWFPHEKWIFGRQHIGCDFTRRGTLPVAQVLAYHTAQVLDRGLDIFRWRTKKRIKSRLRRLLAPFFQRQFARMSGLSSAGTTRTGAYGEPSSPPHPCSSRPDQPSAGPAKLP